MPFFNWLMYVMFAHNQKGLTLIGFMFMKNALYFNNQHTYSDYLIAKFMKDLIIREDLHTNKWIII